MSEAAETSVPFLLLVRFQSARQVEAIPAHALARPSDIGVAIRIAAQVTEDAKGVVFARSDADLLAKFAGARDALRAARQIQHGAALRNSVLQPQHQIPCIIALDEIDDGGNDDDVSAALDALAGYGEPGDIIVSGAFRMAAGGALGNLNPAGPAGIEAYRIPLRTIAAIQATPFGGGIFAQPPAARWGALIAAVLLSILAAIATFMSDTPSP